MAELIGLMLVGSGLYRNDLTTTRIGISIFASANFLESMHYMSEVNSLNERLEKVEK